MAKKVEGVFASTRPCFLVMLIFFPSVQCVKYSSKYIDKDLELKLDTRKRNNENGAIHVKNTFNLEKYFNIANIYLNNDSNVTTSENFVNGSENGRFVEKLWPVKIYDCVESKGLADCLKIFLLRRLNRVGSLINAQQEDSNVSINFDDLTNEVQKDFKWEEYKHLDDKELDKLILKKIKTLVENKKTKLILRSGVILDIVSDGNGAMRLDISKDPDLQLSRGMKMKKTFYKILPMLLVPPLIMSAILPFILPAMKMMIIGAGLLNQMALMGALLTLLRNNAFDDSKSKKVIYVNSGYKNEKKPVVYSENFYPGPLKNHGSFDSHSSNYDTVDDYDHYLDDRHRPKFNTHNSYKEDVQYEKDEEWGRFPSYGDDDYRRKEKSPLNPSIGFQKRLDKTTARSQIKGSFPFKGGEQL